MDSIPIVVFTGQVPTLLIGNDAFQEADIVGISRPCTKHNYLVKETKDLARIIKEAFYIASTGRPGPVLVDMPKDVLAASARYDLPKEVSLRGIAPRMKGTRARWKARYGCCCPGSARSSTRGRRDPVERLRGTGGAFPARSPSR